MNIYINNKLQELQEQAKIKDALEVLDITSQKGIAVAINNNVIPRAEWDGYILKSEDKMILIKATQGG
jgi:sulfur carrier protein